MSANIKIIPQEEFAKISKNPQALSLIADMCRFNTINIVKRAGSGHLGTSFSAMDLAVYLYYQRMNTREIGFKNPERDIYFSSKGHDVPGLYSILYSLGFIERDRLLKLRRLGGLDGHPDTKIPGIEANSGSLGMGISKGKGMAIAKRLNKWGGHVYVLTGDGELQEGQNFEGLQSCAHHNVGNLTVIVDNNKVQSDKPVEEIVSLGNLEQKFAAFGWAVYRVNGHDYGALEQTFRESDRETKRPKIIIADTIKGRGVSFMEHPAALADGRGYYRWHAGAPDDESFSRACQELETKIQRAAQEMHLGAIQIVDTPPLKEEPKKRESLMGEPDSVGDGKLAAQAPIVSKVTSEFVAAAYGEAILEQAAKRSDLLVLDADLSADCRIRDFELKYSERFIENGIAEQDMVSTAGGLARMGFLPVVNSFGTFLAARANEQIYNNASEQTKIIYACHFGGMIPAGPGKSHQSIRDISLFGALPNMIIVQPAGREECKSLVDYCVNDAKENCMIRLNIGPSPRTIPFQKSSIGRGYKITEGKDVLVFAYGPVFLHEAILATELLAQRGIGLCVVNMPWLNRVDMSWLGNLTKDFSLMIVMDDHAPVGGLGDSLIGNLVTSGYFARGGKFHKFAVEGYPACGTPSEALRAHGLDGESVASRIISLLKG